MEWQRIKGMTATLREYYNLVLVRLGIRKVLPAVWINSVEVRECGERMVAWDGALVRSGVAARLDAAERLLPSRFSIAVKSGWRSDAEQEALRRAANEGGVPVGDLSKVVAGRSGHATGGAVDVVLLENGKEADVGGAYLDFARAGGVRSLTKAQKRRRALLQRAMRRAGFVNYPLEWWHFSYGDRMWAAYSRRRYAIYGEISQEGELRWQSWRRVSPSFCRIAFQ